MAGKVGRPKKVVSDGEVLDTRWGNQDRELEDMEKRIKLERFSEAIRASAVLIMTSTIAQGRSINKDTLNQALLTAKDIVVGAEEISKEIS